MLAVVILLAARTGRTAAVALLTRLSPDGKRTLFAEGTAMEMRLPLAGLALGCLLGVAGRTAADDAPKPDLKPFVEETRKLVEKHYPNAKVTLMSLFSKSQL